MGAPLSGKRLLVVAENTELAELVADAAAGLGAEVELRASGRGALEAIAGRGADLAVLDLPLADVTASDLLTALRAKGITAIAVSGVHRGPRAAEEASNLGAAAFFEKPFAVEGLMAAAARLVGADPAVPVDITESLPLAEIVEESADEEGPVPEEAQPPEPDRAAAATAIEEDEPLAPPPPEAPPAPRAEPAAGAAASPETAPAGAAPSSETAPAPEVAPPSEAVPVSEAAPAGDAAPARGPEAEAPLAATASATGTAETGLDVSPTPTPTPTPTPLPLEPARPARSPDSPLAPPPLPVSAVPPPLPVAKGPPRPPPRIQASTSTPPSTATPTATPTSAPPSPPRPSPPPSTELLPAPPPPSSAIPTFEAPARSESATERPPGAPAPDDLAAPFPEPPRERPRRADAPPPRRGDLSRTSVPRVLVALHVAQATGALHLRRGAARKTIAVERGAAVLAVSNVAAERLAAIAVRRGVVARERLDALRAESPGVRTAELLARAGLLDADRRAELVAGQVRAIAWSTFEWREGSYEFELARAPAERVPVALRMGDLVLQGILRTAALERLRADLAPEAHLAPSPDPAFELYALKLGRGEARLLALADGTKSVADLVRLSELPERETLAFLEACRVMRVLDEVERVLASTRRMGFM